jgi:hypothetical protein
MPARPRRYACVPIFQGGGPTFPRDVGGLDELPLTPNLERALALHLVAPVVAVLDLDPAALARSYTDPAGL